MGGGGGVKRGEKVEEGLTQKVFTCLCETSEFWMLR